jgi:outer membrane protein assembly factor BamB
MYFRRQAALDIAIGFGAYLDCKQIIVPAHTQIDGVEKIPRCWSCWMGLCTREDAMISISNAGWLAAIDAPTANRSLRVAMRLMSVAAALAFTLPSFAAVNWLQSYGNSAHTNYNAAETTISPTNVKKLRLQWGSSAMTNGVTSFALFDNVIYAQGQGTSGGVVVAVDAGSGTQLWSTTTGANSNNLNTIAIANSYIFTGCTITFTGVQPATGICAYGMAHGLLKWSYTNEINSLPISGVDSALVYANGALYFAYSVGGSNEPPSYLAAISSKTGATLWNYQTGFSNTIGPATPAFGGGQVYFGCAPSGGSLSGVCALNASGTFLWSVNFGTNNLGLSVGTIGSENVVYINGGSAGEFAALRASDGTPVWTVTGVNSSTTPIAVYGGVLFATGSDGSITKLNRTNGATVWSTGTSADSQASPTLANGVLYETQQGSGNLAVAAYNMGTGKLLWSGAAPASTLHPPPIVANGTLYIANAPCGTLCAYTLPDN